MPRYEMAPIEALDLVDEAVQRWHSRLNDIVVFMKEGDELVRKTLTLKIDVLFAYSTTWGPALKHRGMAALAIARIVNLKDRTKGCADAEIVFDGDKWPTMSRERKLALADHELEHLQILRDADGVPKLDVLRRPRLHIKLHDIEVGWFRDVAARHGAASIEAWSATAIVANDGQVLFPWLDDPAVSDLRSRARFALAVDKRTHHIEPPDLETEAEGGEVVEIARGKRKKKAAKKTAERDEAASAPLFHPSMDSAIDAARASFAKPPLTPPASTPAPTIARVAEESPAFQQAAKRFGAENARALAAAADRIATGGKDPNYVAPTVTTRSAAADDGDEYTPPESPIPPEHAAAEEQLVDELEAADAAEAAEEDGCCLACGVLLRTGEHGRCAECEATAAQKLAALDAAFAAAKAEAATREADHLAAKLEAARPAILAGGNVDEQLARLDVAVEASRCTTCGGPLEAGRSKGRCMPCKETAAAKLRIEQEAAAIREKHAAHDAELRAKLEAAGVDTTPKESTREERIAGVPGGAEQQSDAQDRAQGIGVVEPRQADAPPGDRATRRRSRAAAAEGADGPDRGDRDLVPPTQEEVARELRAPSTSAPFGRRAAAQPAGVSR